MALSKERKKELRDQYRDWAERSKALFLAEYTGLSMKQFDELRASLREVGGEFHVLKNTLGLRAFKDAGLEVDEALFTGSTAVGFAFEDSPATAKALADFAAPLDFVKIKGGYLERNAISAAEIKALADLPPLPVLRAQLMGVLQAPASKLVRILAEPGRGIAAAVRAYAEKEQAAA